VVANRMVTSRAQSEVSTARHWTRSYGLGCQMRALDDMLKCERMGRVYIENKHLRGVAFV